MAKSALDIIDEELDEDAQKDRFLTFHLGKESSGIEIKVWIGWYGAQMPNF